MPSQLLIIDDDKALHALIRAELEPEGFHVHSAFGGRDGVNVAKATRPDLILLDVDMPDMDGFSVCDLIRIQEETSNTPVLFLSSNADPSERARGLNAGAADFMAKPFFGDELRARVRVSLRYKLLLEMETKRATRDGLTGLWNRTYFNDRLRSETAGISRHRYPLSCVMLDIDTFKSINDTYGHPFGDEVIIRVAEALLKTCRAEDVICRYGGEEFVILCPHVPLGGAAQMAERVRAAVQACVLSGPRGLVPVTCSLGVADTRHGLGLDLVKAADAALYAAKRAGRNRVVEAAAEGPALPASPIPARPDALPTATAQPAPTSDVRRAAVRSRFADVHKMQQILGQFIANLPVQVANLDAWLREPDVESLRRAAHQFKGAGAGYGFPQLTELGGRAEEAIAEGAAPHVIRAQVDAMIAFIRSIDGYNLAVEKTPHTPLAAA